MPAKENKMMLFNVKGFISEPSDEDLKKILPANLAVQGHDLDNLLIEDSEALIKRIKGESKDAKPILNIELDTNKSVSVSKEDLKHLQEAGIKVCFSFNQYDAEEEEKKKSESLWKSLLALADHVFFANEEDQKAAISKNHITENKTTFIKPLIEIEKEILKRPANILITGEPTLKLLTDAAEAAKTLGKNTRIIVANPIIDPVNITNLIMAKFALTDENQYEGIKLEVEYLLKNGNGTKDIALLIEKYTKQFEKDLKSDQLNPIDIYLDPKPELLQDIYRQARYTIPQAGNTNDHNGCIPLGNYGTEQDIVAEIKQREIATGINEGFVGQRHQESAQQQLKKVNAILQKIIAEPAGIGANISQQSLLPQNQRQDSDYYSDDKIQTLLEASVDPKTVSVHTCFSLSPAPQIKPLEESTKVVMATQRELLEASFKASIESLQTKDTTAALYVLNIGSKILPDGNVEGSHWIGLVMQEVDGKILFTYNNPTGTLLERDETLKNFLEDQRRALKAWGIESEIKDLHTKQQHNASDCGPWVVENLPKILKNEEITPIRDAKIAAIEGQNLRVVQTKILDEVEAKRQGEKVLSQQVQGPQVVQNIRGQQQDTQPIIRPHGNGFIPRPTPPPPPPPPGASNGKTVLVR